MTSDSIDLAIKELITIQEQIKARIQELEKAKSANVSADLIELEKLTWNHSNKYGNWTFSNNAPKSMQEILRNQGYVESENYRYELSGQDGKFIVRKKK